MAELRGETGQSGEAISQLDLIVADARRRLWPGWALEGELAKLRVLQKTGQMSRAAALKAQVAGEARQKGFDWILQRAMRA